MNRKEGKGLVINLQDDEFEKERLVREHLIALIQRISDDAFSSVELDAIQKQAVDEAQKYTLGVFKDIENPGEEAMAMTFDAFFDGYCLKAGYTYHDE